jgi:PEGA domain-containing protein
MNSRHRPRVSLGDAVGPPNSTTPPSLINIDAEVDDPLLSFASERSPVASSFTSERAPAPSFTPERSPAALWERAPVGRLELAVARSSVPQAVYQREPWAEPRPRGVGGSVVVAFLVLGILIGFAGGYTSVLFNDGPPAVGLPSTAPAGAGESAPLSAASAGAGMTNDASEHLPVGTQSNGPAVEPDSGTATSLSAPTLGTTAPAASALATPGSIEVESRPAGAEVALDGRIVGTTPLLIPDVTEGTHVVGIELAGFSRWATSVYVNKGERARVGASLAP